MTEETARAIYELMMLTAWADERLEASEALVAEALQGEHPELCALPDTAAIAARAHEALHELGIHEALKRAAAPLTTDAERALAFSCCARILEADGVIAKEEFRVLAALKKLFGLDAAAVARALREG